MRDGRLFHLDGAEAAFQRRVGLDQLAVLVAGGGADHFQVAGEIGLQLVGQRHVLGDVQQVQFINIDVEAVAVVDGEIDDGLAGLRIHLRVGQQAQFQFQHALADGLEHHLAVGADFPGGGHQHTAELIGLGAFLGHLAAQFLIAGGVQFGQLLDDGRLADARFTQQYGAAFFLLAEGVHHFFDFGFAADNRGQLAHFPVKRHVAEERGQDFFLVFVLGDRVDRERVLHAGDASAGYVEHRGHEHVGVDDHAVVAGDFEQTAEDFGVFAFHLDLLVLVLLVQGRQQVVDHGQKTLGRDLVLVGQQLAE